MQKGFYRLRKSSKFSLSLSISEYNPFQRDFKFSILVLHDSVINELFFICGAV